MRRAEARSGEEALTAGPARRERSAVRACQHPTRPSWLAPAHRLAVELQHLHACRAQGVVARRWGGRALGKARQAGRVGTAAAAARQQAGAGQHRGHAKRRTGSVERRQRRAPAAVVQQRAARLPGEPREGGNGGMGRAGGVRGQRQRPLPQVLNCLSRWPSRRLKEIRAPRPRSAPPPRTFGFSWPNVMVSICRPARSSAEKSTEDASRSGSVSEICIALHGRWVGGRGTQRVRA